MPRFIILTGIGTALGLAFLLVGAIIIDAVMALVVRCRSKKID